MRRARRSRPPARELDLSTLHCEQRDRVLTVRVQAPPYNFMTALMQRDLGRLVDAVETDETVGAVVFTGGVPGRYVTHFEIAEILATAEHSPSLPAPVASTLLRITRAVHRLGGEQGRRAVAGSPLAGLGLITGFHSTVAAILRSPAVWIGAVNGPCGGGGLELSVFFDLRIAARSARFVLPELSIGLSTTFGGQRLARLVGPSRALEMMLEARSYSSAQMRDWGLVNEVVEDDDLLDHARRRALRYARRPRSVVAAQKRIFNDPAALDTGDSLAAEGVNQTVGVPTDTTRAALRQWLSTQDRSGDSTFLTDPEPWQDGTSVDLNPSRGDAGRR